MYHFLGKKRLVDSCSRWDPSNPEWKFARGFSRFISKTFSRKIGSKVIHAKSLGLVKTSKWNAQFPFGNSFWEFRFTFEEIPFYQKKFAFGETKLIFPFIQSIRNFWILAVTGKQPVFQSSPRINL